MSERPPEDGLPHGLPEDVRALLLRGVGAYLRATPAQELPASVRRFRTFRPAALAKHQKELLAILEDPARRALVVQWLEDGKTSLTREQERALGLAARREEGWQEELVALSTAPDEVPASEGLERRAEELERALEKERAKARKLKEEARAQRETTTTEVARARNDVAEAQQDRAELARRLDAARRAVGDLEDSARKEAERADREMRRLRKELERAKDEADSLRAELKAARKALEQARRAAAPRRKPKPAAAAAAPRARKKETPRGPRRPLPVPQGRFEEDPETLEAWLERDDVLLVVDGYNVTKAEGGFHDLELSDQRDRLIDALGRLARRKKVDTTIVFDGNEIPPGTARLPRGPVKVQYSSPEEIADDHIVALLQELPPYPVILVTNDRELQARGAAEGATVARSGQLLALLR